MGISRVAAHSQHTTQPKQQAGLGPPLLLLGPRFIYVCLRPSIAYVLHLRICKANYNNGNGQCADVGAWATSRHGLSGGAAPKARWWGGNHRWGGNRRLPMPLQRVMALSSGSGSADVRCAFVKRAPRTLHLIKHQGMFAKWDLRIEPVCAPAGGIGAGAH
jgi:hypothetical protein